MASSGVLADRISGPNNLDAIRLLMAVAVIFAHAYPLSQSGAHDPLLRWSNGVTHFGGVAVDVFFAISGYLITLSCERARSWRSFLRRRALRIYPGFFVAAAVSLLLIAPIGRLDFTGYPWHVAIAKLFAYASSLNEISDQKAFLINAFPTAVNGSLWTIKYEFLCYLLTLALAGGRWRIWALPSAAAAALFTHALLAAGSLQLPNARVAFVLIQTSDLVRFVAVFTIAGAFCVFRSSIRLDIFVALLMASTLTVLTRAAPAAVSASLLPLVLPYLVLTLAIVPCAPASNFAVRVGGDYSYGVYLYAFPVQQVTTLAFGGTMSPLMNFAIATPIALLLGMASWHFVEKRFIRRDRLEAKATVVPTT